MAPWSLDHDQFLKWWIDVQAIGPNFGYYPKPSNMWLVVKPEYLERAKEQFHSLKRQSTSSQVQEVLLILILMGGIWK